MLPSEARCPSYFMQALQLIKKYVYFLNPSAMVKRDGWSPKLLALMTLDSTPSADILKNRT